ncbi:hypothetical protein K491DRAFT_722270 [Lophiostoma macrostomum CBS 122681]|uniref:RING-type domain-containing protein n=1 Tax=Lophiostoma macrostomum CBS 122681 TaxID=1314788 RepID=A0A6A6SP67_9PLEO|nr:hypothetical protein K491DRAFT_722270 [Lophiostoma macrostomum CBS 122681]
MSAPGDLWPPLVNVLTPTYEQYSCWPAAVAQDDECPVCLRVFGENGEPGDTKPACEGIDLGCGHVVGKDCWEEHIAHSDDQRCLVCRRTISFQKFYLPDNTLWGRALRYVGGSTWYRGMENFSLRPLKAAPGWREHGRSLQSKTLLAGERFGHFDIWTGSLYVMFEQSITISLIGVQLLVLVMLLQFASYIAKKHPGYQSVSSIMSTTAFGYSCCLVELHCRPKRYVLPVVLAISLILQYFGSSGILYGFFVNAFAYGAVTALLVHRAVQRGRMFSRRAMDDQHDVTLNTSK